jgi:hypothetical protein
MRRQFKRIVFTGFFPVPNQAYVGALMGITEDARSSQEVRIMVSEGDGTIQIGERFRVALEELQRPQSGAE